MRYSPDEGNFGQPIRVGVAPTDLTTGLDAVWVANGEEGAISKINPITQRVVQTIPIGGPVASIAVDESTQTLLGRDRGAKLRLSNESLAELGGDFDECEHVLLGRSEVHEARTEPDLVVDQGARDPHSAVRL